MNNKLNSTLPLLLFCCLALDVMLVTTNWLHRCMWSTWQNSSGGRTTLKCTKASGPLQAPSGVWWCGARDKRLKAWGVKELRKEETSYTKLIFHYWKALKCTCSNAEYQNFFGGFIPGPPSKRGAEGMRGEGRGDCFQSSEGIVGTDCRRQCEIGLAQIRLVPQTLLESKFYYEFII